MQEGKWYPSRTHELKTSCGDMFLVIDRDVDSDNITRVHLFGGKQGTCASTQNNTICKFITAMMLLKRSDRIKVINEVVGGYCNHKESCSSQALRIVYEQTLDEKKTK